jgi:hypothetical protein
MSHLSEKYPDTYCDLPACWPFKTEAERAEYDELRAKSQEFHNAAHALFLSAVGAPR